jgi:hypothetical protein
MSRDPKEYGFIEGEQGFRRVGDTEDFTYVSHIGQIPVITKPGYLKMSFTKTMKDLLLKWYEERRKDSIEDHGTILLLLFFFGNFTFRKECTHVCQFYSNMVLGTQNVFTVNHTPNCGCSL